MNWPVMRPAILAAVKDASGVAVAVWKGSKEEAGWSPTGTIAKLSVGLPRDIGSIGRRASYDPNTGVRTVTHCVAKQFSLAVRFETQDGTDAGFATMLADRLVSRIYRTHTCVALRAVDLSTVDAATVQVLDGVKIQGRVISVAIVELTMNGVENDVDDTAGSADWIEEVTTQGTLTRPDGTTTTINEVIG